MLAEPWRKDRAAPRWMGQAMTSCTGVVRANLRIIPSSTPPTRGCTTAFNPGTYGKTCSKNDEWAKQIHLFHETHLESGQTTV